MSLGRLCHVGRRLPLIFGMWLVATLVHAQATPTAHFQWDVGIGHESQASPLFQISPESNIIYQDGVDRLSGSHIRSALQGAVEWDWGGGTVVSLAGDATFKRSPATPGFDMATVGLQPSVQWPAGSGSTGVGLNLQQLNVAGQHFRDVAGIQANWTRSDGQHLWGIVADAANYTHNAALSDMDAIATSWVVLRQIRNPLPGINGIDFSGVFGREANVHGFSELSSRSAMATMLVRWSWFSAEWSAGLGWRRALFDDTAFPDEPVREDRTTMLDVAVQWPLAADRSVRVEFNESRNNSTTRLYDNHYSQISVTLRSSF